MHRRRRGDASGGTDRSAPGRDERAAFGIEEIPVTLSIRDGKISAESKSGPKSGSAELAVDGSAARLVLTGAGSDEATATFTGPELGNFRTMVDAALSRMLAGDEPGALGRDVLASGYRPLTERDGTYSVSFETDTLRRLGLLTEGDGIAGGGRQVQCTVLGNGTAILNLRGEDPGAPR